MKRPRIDENISAEENPPADAFPQLAKGMIFLPKRVFHCSPSHLWFLRHFQPQAYWIEP